VEPRSAGAGKLGFIPCRDAEGDRGHRRGGREQVRRSRRRDRRASRVISAEYEAPFLSHATMEPMNCTASFTDGKVEIWSPTQFPDWATSATAAAAEIPPTDVKVHVTLMGGGFGRRINPDFSVEAALVSKAAGKPVKVVWTRADDLRHDFYRPCAMHRMDATWARMDFPRRGGIGLPIRLSAPSTRAQGRLRRRRSGRLREHGLPRSEPLGRIHADRIRRAAGLVARGLHYARDLRGGELHR
jgi:hypothetical protein